MKQFLVLLAAVWVAAACASKTANLLDDSEVVPYEPAQQTAQLKEAKYQIIDQEFDNLLAPDSDYDTLSASEMQSCNTGYVPPTTKLKTPKAPTVDKAAVAKKVVVSQETSKKKVINNVNIHYIDGPAPAVPARSSSNTTVTTYTTSTSSSGNY